MLQLTPVDLKKEKIEMTKQKKRLSKLIQVSFQLKHLNLGGRRFLL